jgi:hypothetical protein
MKINRDVSNLQLLRQTSISEHEIKKTEDLLGLVLKLMEHAKGVSDKFMRDTRPDDEALVVCDALADLKPPAFSVCSHHNAWKVRVNGTVPNRPFCASTTVPNRGVGMYSTVASVP